MEPAVAVSALLAPPVTAEPPVLRADDVGGRHSWRRLVRDGDLLPVTDDVAVPAGVPVTAAVRGAALAARVPPRAVVVGETALWVHCGGVPDHDLELAYRSSVFRLGADSVDVGGVRVTTPERTAVDLACRLPHGSAVEALVALARAGADLRAAQLMLEARSRAVGRPAAREAFRAARDRLAPPPGAA